MNEVINSILSRRSVRDYQDRQIADEELDLILKAGCYAPSAMNQQSWHFIAVQNKELIAKIVEGVESNPFYNAPTVVLVYGDKTAIDPLKDGSLAMENMFLAAHSIGIGSCWINSVVRLFNAGKGDSLTEELKVPDGYQCVACCILGYPNETPEPKPRKEGTIHIIK